MRPLTEPEHRVRADDLRRWRAQFRDSVPIATATPRQRAVCVGVVRALRLVPGQALEVSLEDGSGRLTATFAGRSRLQGLEMGSGLRVAGTLLEDGHGERSMRNPDWSFVAEPYT